MAVNKKIKGITVTIGADTTDMGKALSANEKEAEALAKELKSVESLLKFNPDSIELLTQKQDLLNAEVEKSVEKLNVLKKAQEEVKEQWKNGDIGEEEMRAFQREVIATTGKLNHYNAEIVKVKEELAKLSDETTDTTTDTEKLTEELSDVQEELNDVAVTADDTAGKIAKIGAVAIAGGVYAVKSADDTKSAMNSLQAQTGLTADEMNKYKDVLEDIYRNNYGEDMNDIANTMAMIKQYTGDIDAGTLKDMTIDAITLRDTFGFEISETIRGVDALITHMGVDASTAFNLMAKGAQNGLDKSGELADNIAEYTQIWAQAGFNAEEMFTILDNGLESGAYNLDKVNDFVKEFSISLADGRIEENISSFSAETKDLFEAWKRGEASTRDVFYSIISDLSNMENQQEALTLASNTWSALGEDNALAVITALDDVNATYQDVATTMEDIQNIKYDDLKNDWKALGREVQLEVIQPLGEELLPVAQKFFEFTAENLDEIIPLATTLGATFASIFVVNKVATFTKSLSTLKTAFSSLWTVAAANPIGTIAIGLTGIAVAAYSVYEALTEDADAYEKARNAAKELSLEERKLIETINESAEAYQNIISVRDSNSTAVSEEYGYYETLWDELQNIVEANGQVKTGYEDRAAVITSILADALGMEIELTDGVIDKYDELGESIDSVIQIKKAEALLSANEEAYTTAIQNQTQAYMDYSNAVNAIQATEEERITLQNELAEAYQKLDYASSEDEIRMYRDEIAELEGTISGLNVQYGEQAQAVETAGETYSGYMSTIANYEGLMSAVATNDVEAMNQAITNLTYNFKTATTATATELREQVSMYQTMYDDMKKAVEEGAPGVTQAQLDAMAELVIAAEEELDKLPEDAGAIGYTTSRSFSTGIRSGRGDVADASTSIADESSRSLGSGSGRATSIGTTWVSNFIEGLKSKVTDAQNAGYTIGLSTQTGIGLVSLYQTGADSGQGFINGLNSKASAIEITATSLASKALTAFNEKLDINSPSKETEDSGGFFDDGFALGVEKNAYKVEKSVQDMSVLALNAIDNTEISEKFRLYDDIPSNSRVISMLDEKNSGLGNTSTRNFNINLNIGEFVNNRTQDVRDLAEEIMMYAQEFKEEEDRVYA